MPRPKKKVEAKSKPKREEPLSPEAKQEELDNLRYIVLINKIRRSNKDAEINAAFEEILSKLKPRICKIVNKFAIPGFSSDDIFQESLRALRFKAIKDYDKTKGATEGLASFERFAVLCIRRHLSTEFKSSFQNKKKTLNIAASLDCESNGSDEDLALINIIPASEGDVLDMLQHKESIRNFMTELLLSLSGFEKEVFRQYANGETYEEIALRLNEKRTKSKVKVKSIDNALSRIKNKAKSIVDANEEFKSLVPSRRKRSIDEINEGDYYEV